MKKILYLFMALLISQNLLAQTVTKTWRGTTSTSWATASNWSPSGVPTASDVISIDNVTNDPVIASAVTATCRLIYLNASATLTINSGGTLTVAETSASSSGVNAMACATGAILMNNGTLNISSNASGISFDNDNVSFTNNGTVTFNVPVRIFFFRANNPTVTNNGTMTLNGTGVAFNFVPSTITGTSIVNTGTINHNSTSQFITLPSSNSFTNSGTINIAGTYIYVQGGTFTNQSCGKIYMGAGGDFDNSTSGSTTSNAGMISIVGTLNNTIGTFNNNGGGVLKYGSLTGSITNNNGSVIINNNPTNSTIFTYQGTFTGTVNGIFTNVGATTSAGTFTAPNTFVPSGLPVGSQTLYAKITPSGGACSYVVPFTYNNVPPPPTIVTNPTNTTICGSNSTSFSIVATNASSYQWQLSTDGGLTFNNLSNVGVYSNVTASTLNISNVTGLNTYQYRCIATNLGGSTNSTSATLTVLAAPTFTKILTKRLNVPCESGTNGELNFSVSGGTGPFTYNLNGVTNTTGIFTGLSGGEYTLTITDGNGCSKTSIEKVESVTNFTNLNNPSITNDYTADSVSQVLNYLVNPLPVRKPNGDSLAIYGQGNLNAISKFIPIGFKFKFDNFNYDSLVVSEDGVLAFNRELNPTVTSSQWYNNSLYSGKGNVSGGITSDTAYINRALPFIAAFWDDMQANSTRVASKISYQLSGTAPNRKFTVEWKQMRWNRVCNTQRDNSATIQVTLYETTNVIETAYKAEPFLLSNNCGDIPNVNGYGYTIGLFGRRLGAGNFLSYNPNVSGTGRFSNAANSVSTANINFPKDKLFRFTPPTAPTVCTLFATTNAQTTCSTGSDGTITLTASGGLSSGGNYYFSKDGGATYTLSTSNNGQFTFTGLAPGTYTIFVHDSQNYAIPGNTNPSTWSFISQTVTVPGVVFSTVRTNPTTVGGTNGSIALNGLVANTTYTVNYNKNGTPVTSANLTSNGTGTITLSGLTQGSYTNIILSFGGCNSSAASVTLTDPPSITTQPSSTSICVGTNTSFSIVANNATSYQWQVNTGSGFTNLANGASYSNVTTSTLNITNAQSSLNTYQYRCVVTGTNGTINSNSATLTVTQLPTITVGAAINPASCGGTDGSIAFTTTNLANGSYTLNYSKNGVATTATISVLTNAFTLSGLTAGTYTPFSITNNGCSTGSVTTSKTLSDPATPTLTVGTSTNPTTCGGTNGSIAFTTTNLADGNYTLNYSKNGVATTATITVLTNIFTLSGLTVGTYTPFSITNNGCSTGSVTTSKTLSDPPTPTLTAGTASGPSTCGGASGSIPFTSTNLPDGTYSMSFTATGAGATTSPQSVTVSGNIFTLSGLKAGTYSNFSVTTAANCTGTVATSLVLTNPAAPTLTVGTAVSPTTCGGANGSIPFTSTNLPNGTYSLSFTATGTGATTSPQSIIVSGNIFSLTGLKAGTYSAFSVTNAGCTGTVATSKVLADPATPTLTAGTANSPTTCGGTGSIAFTSTNLPNGTYSLSFTATGTGVTTSPQSVIVSANTFTLSGLKAGTYSNFSLTTLAGCTGTVATAKTLVDPPTPTLTGGLISHPATCGGTGNIRFNTTNLPNGSYSMSFTATGSGVTTSPQNVAVSANFLYLSNLTAGTYSNFSLTTSTGCTSSLATPLTLNPPSTPTLTAGTLTNPTSCAGADGSIAFTTSSLSSGTYSLSFTATGTGATSSPQNVTASANVFSLSGLKAGTYSNFSLTTAAGCTGTVATAKTLTDPTAPTLTAGTSVNPATCGGSNGSIPFTSTDLPNGTYSLSFTATGTGATTSPKSVTVSANVFSLTGLKAGTYSNFSVTSIGCTGTDASSKTLSDPATPTISAGTVVNPATCGATGSIPFTATNLPDGTYSLSFTATGTGATTSPRNVTVLGNAFSLTGLSVGSYSNFSLISTGCTATDATSKSIANPTTPTLVAGTVVNPSSCGGTDGAIPFTTNLPDGTYSLTYTGTGSPKSIMVSGGVFTLGTLGSGGYSNFSVTNKGCIGTLATSKSLSDPAAPVLTLGTRTNPSACNLADGSIAFTTTNIADGTYSLNYSGAGSPQSVIVSANTFTLTGLADGVYSNFSITNENGCTGSLSSSVTLVDLALPVLTVGTANNPSTCAGTQGTIAFTTANLPDGTYSLSFSSTGTTSPQSITVASNAFILSGLSAGTYNNFSVTRLGCTGSVSTSKTLVDPATPTLSVGTTSNPSACAGTDGSINFTTTNLANGTYSLSFTSTGTVSPKNVTVTNNAFTLNGLSAGNYSNFSITNNGCTATDATAKTLTDPPSVTLAVGTSTNPTTCSGTNGSISFTTTNLPNGTYTLTYTGAGSPKTVTVATNAFSISNLSAGAYSNFSITYLGCTGSDTQTKTLFDPESATITAGTVTNPTTCGGTNGSIAFTSTNLPNGNYSLAYTGSGSPQTVTVSGNTFTLTGLSAGSYSDFSLVSSGCTAIDPSTKSLVAPTTPTLTAGTVTNPSTCNGTDGSIAFTTSLGNGTYSLAYTGAGSPQNITVVSGAFTLTGLQDGVYANFSIISNGCTAIDATSKTLVDPATPTLTVGTVTNPSTCNGTDGSIAFTTSLADGTYSLVYTGAGSPQNITVASGAFTLTGLQDGVYANFSITSNGCVAVASASKTLVDPAIPTITAGTVTNPSICSGTDGAIAFTTSLPDGTYSLNYTGVGSPKTITVVSGAFNLTGLSSGTYSGFSVSTNGCTGTDATAKTLTDPAAPTLTAGTVTNPTTCLSSDGKIAFTTSFPNGTYTLNYTGTGSPKSITVVSGAFELTGLGDGTFSGFSITANGCTGTDATTKTLTDPAAPTLTAGTATNPSTCLSSDGSIAFTTSLPNGTYTLNYTGTGSPKSITVLSGRFTLTGLPDGVFSGFSVTTGGCTGVSSASITLTDPAAPTITAGTITNPSTCNGNDGSIAFMTTLPNGTYTLNYTGSGSPKTITVASGAFTLTGLPSGDYSGFTVTTGGCSGIDNKTKTLVNPNPPTLSAGTVTNPSTCSGTGSINFTTNLANGTYDLTYTGAGSPKSITVSSGTFTLSGLLAGTYSNFSIDNNLGCVGTDVTSKTLADPLTPTLTIGAETNPSTCSGTDGSIAFTTNLPNGTYSLAYTGTGSPKSVTVSSGAFTLSGLSAGTYENFAITVNGCTGNESSTKVLSDPTPPTVIAGSNSAICSGTSLNLTSDISSAVYEWNGPNNFTSTEQNPTILSATTQASGTYTIKVTTSGCTASSTVEVFVNPVPTTPTPNAVAPISMGSSVTLTATGCAGTLKWYLSSNDAEVTNPVSPTTATGYYAKCEITANGISCLSDKSVNVTVGVIAVQIVYVNGANTSPTQDGTSWATAYADLSAGLTSAGSITGTPVEVWVAQGTYKPTTTLNRSLSFNISNKVKVYGGFAGTESQLSERNFKTNTTVLSGEIGNKNSIADNSYHVVLFSGVDNNTVLDGFTITGGNAEFDIRLVVNLPITNAPATTTQTRGGGIDLENGSSPIISNCIITNNTAVSGGGIFAGDNSIPSIVFSKIVGNQATFGSGVYFQDGSNATIQNTLIAGNKGIGAVYNNLANPNFTNCTFAGNGGYNGGIFNSTSQPVIKNSILWGNSAPFNDTQSVITNSIVQNGYAGVGNLNYDPQFVSQIPDGLAPNNNGDYHLKANSLAIDRGDNGSITLTDTDLDGNLRRYNGGRVDLGAYEYQGSPTATLVISISSGNWESNSTWDVGRTPTIGDFVIIDQAHTVSLSTEGTAKNVQFRGTGTLKFNSANSKLNTGL